MTFGISTKINTQFKESEHSSISETGATTANIIKNFILFFFI